MTIDYFPSHRYHLSPSLSPRVSHLQWESLSFLSLEIDHRTSLRRQENRGRDTEEERHCIIIPWQLWETSSTYMWIEVSMVLHNQFEKNGKKIMKRNQSFINSVYSTIQNSCDNPLTLPTIYPSPVCWYAIWLHWWPMLYHSYPL